MNQIILRTNKGEYNPGEEVFGVVYLNIANVTAGRGVKMKLRGVEYFVLEVTEGSTTSLRDHAKKDYIDCSDVTLFEEEAPLMLGSYIFPFSMKLLSEIPGTFKAGDRTENLHWEARVHYWLKAEVIDAENMQAHQDIIVLSVLPFDILPSDPTQAVAVEQDVYKYLLLKRKIGVTARLLDSVQQSGEYTNLRIILTNDSGVDVVGIFIKVIRDLTLISKQGTGTEDGDGEGRGFTNPEGTQKVVWDTEIMGCGKEVLNHGGLDKIRICLKDKDGNAIYPTCDGQHIQCQYWIEVLVKLENNDTVTLNVPMYCILPEMNKEWHSWHPPDWTYTAKVMKSQGPLRVSENVLCTEAYSGIPGFQALG